MNIEPYRASAIEFTVYGDAKPAGSKRAMPIYRKGAAGRELVTRANGSPVIAVVDDNPKSRDWKNSVRSAARHEYRGELLRGPLKLTLVFYRPRNKGHFNSRGELNKTGREATHPVTKPDVLKLARGVEDALTGVLYGDDAQICVEVIEKAWGEPARVEICLESIDENGIKTGPQSCNSAVPQQLSLVKEQEHV